MMYAQKGSSAMAGVPYSCRLDTASEIILAEIWGYSTRRRGRSTFHNNPEERRDSNRCRAHVNVKSRRMEPSRGTIRQTISLCFILFLFLSLQSSAVVRSDANRVAGSSSQFKEGLIETERVVASATVREDGGGRRGSEVNRGYVIS